ncbi:hypothetical protein HJU46_08465 [Clostridium butyricum]|nr:hypothetical protein [Clostridium butyricum]
MGLTEQNIFNLLSQETFDVIANNNLIKIEKLVLSATLRMWINIEAILIGVIGLDITTYQLQTKKLKCRKARYTWGITFILCIIIFFALSSDILKL